MAEEESPEMLPLYEDLLTVQPSLEEADSDADSDLLNLDETEDDDDFTIPVQQSRPSSASEAAPPPADSSLYEVCKHLESKLGIKCLAALDAEAAERDLYDDKRLPTTQQPAKQLRPVVPACMKEMRQ